MEAKIKTKELNAFVQKFAKDKETRGNQIIKAMTDSLELIRTIAITEHLTGGTPIWRRTGTLIGNVRYTDITRRGNVYSAKVGVPGTPGSKGPGFYGRVLEFGAQTPGHIVRPKRAKYLKFRAPWGVTSSAVNFLGLPRVSRYGSHGEAVGMWVTTKQVVMKPKPWLKSSLDKSIPEIQRLMACAGLVLRKRGGKP